MNRERIFLAIAVLGPPILCPTILGQTEGTTFVAARLAAGAFKGETPFDDGVPVNAAWPDIPDLPEGSIAVDTTNQFYVDVFERLENLAIIMQAESDSLNFDFFVRYNQPIEVSGEGQIFADAWLTSPGGFEEFGVWSHNLPDTFPARYYVAMGTRSRIGGYFTLVAEVDRALVDLTSGVAVPIACGYPGPDPEGGNNIYTDGHQYRFEVPTTATTLYVRLEPKPVTNPAFLALRYFDPSYVSNESGILETDLVSTLAGGFQELCLTGYDVVGGAVLYVWILGDSDNAVVRGELTVTADGCEHPLAIGEEFSDAARAHEGGGVTMLGGRQHVITLPDAHTKLTIALEPAPEQPGDLDFYVRANRPVEIDDATLIFDFAATAPSTAPEVLLLNCLDLEGASKLYVLVANGNAMPVAYTLKATGDPENPCFAPGATFLRGDASASNGIDTADAIFTLTYIFGEGAVPPCLDAADANDDGAVTISDAIIAVQHIFLGRELPQPFGACGADPTTDELGCSSFPSCGRP